MLGSAKQLQPARPCTRNTDEALPNRSVGGRRLGGPAVGCSAAAPARSPTSQPTLPARQQHRHSEAAGASPCLLAPRGQDRARDILCPKRRREETEAFPDPEQRDTLALSPATGSASTTAPLHTTQLHCGNLFWSPQAPQQLLLVIRTTPGPRDNVLLLSTDKRPPTPQPLHIPRVSGWRDGAPGPSSATDPHCQLDPHAMPCPIPVPVPIRSTEPSWV